MIIIILAILRNCWKYPRSLLKKKLHEYDLEDTLIVRDIIESDLPLEQKISDLEAKLILEALWKCNQDKRMAADLLGINFRSLRYRIDKFKIDSSDRIETIYFSMLEEHKHTRLFEPLFARGHFFQLS